MQSMLKVGRAIFLGLLLLLLAVGESLAQPAEPFRIRNLNPLVAIFGLPAWETVNSGTAFGATVEVGNHYRLSRRGNDVLVLDGETLRTTLAFTHGFAERWAVGAELPHYQLSGGVLDDLIDGWHSAFGMPDGGRNNRPEDELLFLIGDQAGVFFELDRRQRGFGDVQLKLARAIGPDQGFVVQGTVKVPTGDEGMLAGSGSADWSLTLLRSRELRLGNRPAGFFWGAGLLRAGEPEPIDFAAETLVYTGVVGGSWEIRPRFGVKAQLDFHSPFFNTPLEELGENAIQATVGGWFRANERSVIEFALVEDLEVSTAPDVVLHVAARWLW
ncbi:MAG TPA: DUF3187 family protein [Gammaproteobacteria bacterium]|nr:DUF3187 family protein [Gammaproteobacteria bacterium]